MKYPEHGDIIVTRNGKRWVCADSATIKKMVGNDPDVHYKDDAIKAYDESLSPYNFMTWKGLEDASGGNYTIEQVIDKQVSERVNTVEKNIPHKNAEVIKAWAEGKVIQWQAAIDCWMDYNPSDEHHLGPWDNRVSCNWRIKPEVKPDVVKYVQASRNRIEMGNRLQDGDNLKLTFDGETGKLKNAEVI